MRKVIVGVRSLSSNEAMGRGFRNKVEVDFSMWTFTVYCPKQLIHI